MWRPAVSIFGALAAGALVACWSTKTEVVGPTGPTSPESKVELAGSYWCTLSTDGSEYDRNPCIIKKVGDTLTLAKYGGSERMRGTIVPDQKDGFSFVGEKYCPQGDCTQQLHGRFKPSGNGGFKGMFREDTSLVVKLTPAAANAFAGAGYGGDEYADGGMGIGGYSYGASRFDSRGRRRP